MLEKGGALVAVSVCAVISGLSEWSSFRILSTEIKFPLIVLISEDVHFRSSWQHSAKEGMVAQLLPFDIKLSAMFLLKAVKIVYQALTATHFRQHFPMAATASTTIHLLPDIASK